MTGHIIRVFIGVALGMAIGAAIAYSYDWSRSGWYLEPASEIRTWRACYRELNGGTSCGSPTDLDTAMWWIKTNGGQAVE